MFRLIFLLTIAFHCTKSESALKPIHILNILKQYKDVLSPFKLLDIYKVEKSNINVTLTCQEHINISISRLRNETWPIQMIDAWGKFPEGLLSGHFAMMGDFAECMSLRGNFNGIKTEPIKGKYCPMHLILNSANTKNAIIDNLKSAKDGESPLYSQFTVTMLLLSYPTLAACLPASCTRDDFLQIFSILTNYTNGAITPITSYCRVDDKPPLDAVVITMMAVSGLLILVTFVGSLVDLFYVQPKKNLQPSIGLKILLAFSFPTNLEKILNTKTTESNLGCLHGLRFLSMCWVILGHTWSLLHTTGLWNSASLLKIVSPWTVLSVLNGTFCVDTFFTIGGFLLGYQILLGLDKSNGKFNPLLAFVHRYMRLTPTYAFLIGIIAAFLPLVSNGPMWSLVEMNAKYCRRNWWENLLYVNNLLHHDTENDFTDVPCFGESWYLGCDMQFFVVSIWAIYLIWKCRKLGLLLLMAMTVVSIATPGVIIGTKNLVPVYLLTRQPTGEEKGNYDLEVYVKPWTRIGPYLAGIWGGYFYYLTKTSSFRLSKYIIKLGWLISTVSGLAIIYGPADFFDPEIPLPKVGSIVYGTFARFSWGVVIAWIIYACVSGNGGIVNKILSAKVFMPLARTSFCVYLISYELQQLFHARYPQPLSFDIYFLTNLFFAHLCMSLLFGFGLTLLIESPFIQLEKIIFGKFR